MLGARFRTHLHRCLARYAGFCVHKTSLPLLFEPTRMTREGILRVHTRVFLCMCIRCPIWFEVMPQGTAMLVDSRRGHRRQRYLHPGQFLRQRIASQSSCASATAVFNAFCCSMGRMGSLTCGAMITMLNQWSKHNPKPRDNRRMLLSSWAYLFHASGTLALQLVPF